MKQLRFLVATVVLCGALPVAADTITGKVVGVTDGDTITVLDATQTQHKIRLDGIDTPEKGQAFGTQAKKALSDKVFAKQVTVKYKERDRYGRIVGIVMLGNRWINHEMVAEGWAWHYKQYSSDQNLAAAEIKAREARKGLWHDGNPVPPWDWRRAQRNASQAANPPGPAVTPAAASTDGPYWLNTGSNTRHNAKCKWFKKTKRGRMCGPNDGKACGGCGG